MAAYYPRGRLARRLIPLPSHDCIYVKNPKAGCTTLLLWLHRIHTGERHFLSQETIHFDHGLPRPRELGWDRIEAMLSGAAFRFTFVREPLRRIESAYRDKIAPEDRENFRRQVRHALGLPQTAGASVTFEQFVTALETQDPLQMDPHWRPQHLNLMHGLVDYDFIGRLESFDADLARLRDLTGLPDVPVEVRNTTSGRTEGLLDARPDLRRRVEAVYERDFELYGY